MFKLGYKLLVSRKGWLCLIIVTIAIVLACIISVSTASESIKNALKEHAYENYGEHTVVLLDSMETKETLSDNNVIKKIGKIEIIGNIEFKDEFVATVGTLDKQVLDMGRIKLLSGSFPNNKNEIVIESSYLSIIDKDWKIGESKVLNLNNKKLEFVLSGIIKDYSAKWTVSPDLQKGVNDFPNIILSNKSNLELESKNFLVQLDGNINNTTLTEEIAFDYLEEHNGFFNERLFYNGLANYQDINTLTLIFQLIIFVASFLCMYCLFYFFNIKQQKKLAILKAIGSTNKELRKINLSQNVILLLMGVVLSLPLAYFLHIWIINKTFNISNLESSNYFYMLGLVALCIIVYFCMTLYSSFLAINHIKNSTINRLLKESHFNKVMTNIIPTKVNDFKFRKTLNKLMTNSRHYILVVLILTISLLTINFSTYIEKESAGIWDTKIDYYLNSQEIYGYDVVNNLVVLHQEGLTFSPQIVNQLKNNEGVKFIEKSPFMKDVHPILKESILTPHMKEVLLGDNSEDDVSYNNDYIIPNVRYVLVNEDEFSNLYPNLVYEDFAGKVILHTPAFTKKMNDNFKIDNSDMTFVQTKKDGVNHSTKSWNLEIMEIINDTFNYTVNSTLNIEYSNFIIVMSEETAINEGLFNGYNELAIYLNNQIERKDIEQFESKLSEVIALTPGSLYQKISTVIEDDKRISLYVGYLGKLTYLISVILSIISTTVLVYSKYKMQKKEWAIYLTVGMKKKEVYYQLLLEMIVFLIIATILSFIVFSFTQFLDNLYTYFYYLKRFCLSILFILLLIIISWSIVVRIIKKHSIYSLIQEEE